MKQNIQTSQTPGTTQTGSNVKPETWNLKPGWSYPPSVQVDLFGYLKPHQQATLRPYLRLIKRPYQEKLCVSLLDYLEGHGLDPQTEPVLHRLQAQIIDACDLHPLTTREPKSIGTVIKQLFG